MSKEGTYAVTVRPLNGLTDDMVSVVLDFFKDQPWIYGIEMSGTARHMHMGTYYKFNPGQNLRRELQKKWPEEFAKTPSVKAKMWFKGDLGEGTWQKYIAKENNPISNRPEDFDWYSMLRKDKELHERRKQAWQAMHFYSQLFLEHDLPFSTVEEVWNGLEQLAYVLKVTSLPRMSDRASLRVDLFHYMNGTTGSLDTADRFLAGRKRKRDEPDPDRNLLAEKWDKFNGALRF